jgi:molybdate transport system regulatory protein
VADQFQLDGALWMRVGEQSFGGKDRIELLAMIDATGSITQAAKAIKMSYKAAWDAIDNMNQLAGEALVERLAGGKGGGGTRLTPRGHQLIANFRVIEQAHSQFLQHLNVQSVDLATDFSLIKKMAMKTSIRNQFSATISSIQRGAVNDEITLCTSAGQQLIAVISQESTVELGLAIGASVLALVDVNAIMVVTDADGASFSARNRLSGHISRIHPGAVNTEIVMATPAGDHIAAMLTNDSARSLGLAIDAPITAIFKASALMLAVVG